MSDNKLDSVSKGINIGVFWLLALRLLLKSISIVSTLILVRLLAPEDFGLVALAMSFYALIELFSAFGFEAAIVQTRNATDKHYSTIWTIRFFFSILMCLLVNLGAGHVAEFYGEPSLELVVRVTSFLFILNAVKNPGMIRFIKDMDFKTEFKYQATTKFSSFIVTIGVALWLRNYYALLIGMYASTLIGVILSYWYSKFRPTFCLTHAKELFNFSKWMVINAWLNYLNTRTGEIVIGYFQSSKFVGLFNVGHEIASLPATEMGAAINRSSYSGYAKAEGDLALLRQLFVKVLGNISLVTVAAGTGIYLLAHEISHWVLGPGWEATQPVIEFIALTSILNALSTNHQYIYLALGKPRITTLMTSIRVVLLFSLLIPMTMSEGLLGASKAFFYTSLIFYPLPLILTIRLIHLELASYFRAIQYHLLACALMAAAILGLPQMVDLSNQPMFVLVLIKVTLGVTVFLTTLSLTWWLRGKPKDTAESELFQLAWQKFARAR